MPSSSLVEVEVGGEFGLGLRLRLGLRLGFGLGWVVGDLGNKANLNSNCS